MSFLTEVRKSLGNNRGIRVVDFIEEVHLPRPDGFWTHTVDYFVAPRTGIYTADELQAFMLQLIPIPHSAMDAFRGNGEYMYFGKLYFDEPIGRDETKGNRKIVITDPDVPTERKVRSFSFNLDRDKDLMRRIWVRLYPDVNFAMRALGGVDQYETRHLLVPS